MNEAGKAKIRFIHFRHKAACTYCTPFAPNITSAVLSYSATIVQRRNALVRKHLERHHAQQPVVDCIPLTQQKLLTARTMAPAATKPAALVSESAQQQPSAGSFPGLNERQLRRAFKALITFVHGREAQAGLLDEDEFIYLVWEVY